MKMVGRASVADAFEAWGRFESVSRRQGGEDLAGLGMPYAGPSAIDVILTVRAPMAWRILKASPKRCARVLFNGEDEILITDGRTLDAWTDAVAADQTRSGHEVRRLAANVEPVPAPFLCVRMDGAADAPVSPLILLDGWHRAAAWRLHGRAGNVYPVEGYVIITKDAMQMLADDHER